MMSKDRCSYDKCGRPLPPGAGAGVALSRIDSNTRICSSCGMWEAVYPELIIKAAGKFDPKLDFNKPRAK